MSKTVEKVRVSKEKLEKNIESLLRKFEQENNVNLCNGYIRCDMGYWSGCKNEIARILKAGGRCISFGWNSNGIGKNRGFRIDEILICAHGGSKNDTICTVETKVLTKLYEI